MKTLKKIVCLLLVLNALNSEAQTSTFSEVRIYDDTNPKLRFRNYDDDDDEIEYRYWDIVGTGSNLKFRFRGPTTSSNPSNSSLETVMNLWSGGPDYNELAFNGKIVAEELQVKELNLPDYVFDTNYSLLSLQELKSFITNENHLPNVPSAKEIMENGMPVGEMISILLRKIEELTLYTIMQQEKIDELENKTR